MSKIVYKINKELEYRRINKTEFADKIKVSRDTVYNWTDENIKISVLKRVSDFLGKDISYFLNDDAELSKKTEANSIETLTYLVSDIKSEIANFRRETIELLKKKKK